MTDKKPIVTCKWLEEGKVLVNPDGQVVPCCYMANPLLLHLTDETQARMWQNNPVLKKYVDNKNEFNLNTKTLQEVLTSDWFNKDLPASWEDYTILPSMCQTFCDENYTNEDI